MLKDLPRGGIDVFGCTRQVRDRLLELKEVNTNLIALLFWLGFRRRFVPYERQPRLEGRSAWTIGRKFRYELDSVFSFTDLPIKWLLWLGVIGTSAACIAGVTVFVAWSLGHIPVLGYTPLMLVISFFGGLTALGLGIVGEYLWLSLQNARARPAFVVKSTWSSSGDSDPSNTLEPHALAAPPIADRTRRSRGCSRPRRRIGRKHQQQRVGRVSILDGPDHRRQIQPDAWAIECDLFTRRSVVHNHRKGSAQAHEELTATPMGVLTAHVFPGHIEHDEITLRSEGDVLGNRRRPGCREDLRRPADDEPSRRLPTSP